MIDEYKMEIEITDRDANPLEAESHNETRIYKSYIDTYIKI